MSELTEGHPMKDPLQSALDKVNGVYKPPLPKFPVPVAKLFSDGYYVTNIAHAMVKDNKLQLSVFTATDVEAYAKAYAASLPKLDVDNLLSKITEFSHACEHNYLNRIASVGNEIHEILRPFE